MISLLARHADAIASSHKKIPESVLLIDKKGHLIYLSEHLSTRLGYNSTQLQQKYIQDIDPSFTPDRYFSLTNNNNSSYQTFQSLFYGKNGEAIPVHLFITVENSQEEIFLVANVREISALDECSENKININKQEVEKQNDLLRFLLDEVPSPLVVKDYDGKFVFTNKAVANLYGTSTPKSITP